MIDMSLVLKILAYVMVISYLTAMVKIGWYWCSFVGVLSFLVVGYFFGSPILPWVFENWWAVLALSPVYLTLGLIWSFVKWHMFLLDFLEAREIVLRSAGHKLLSKSSYGPTNLSKTPKFNLYRRTVLAWVFWWPLSMLGFLFTPRKFFSRFFQAIASSYQWMADRVAPEYPES